MPCVPRGLASLDVFRWECFSGSGSKKKQQQKKLVFGPQALTFFLMRSFGKVTTGWLLSQHLLVLSRAKTWLHAREAKQKAIRKWLCGGDFLIKFNLLPFPGSKQERATTREPDKTGETITQDSTTIPALHRMCASFHVCPRARVYVCVSLLEHARTCACMCACVHLAPPPVCPASVCRRCEGGSPVPACLSLIFSQFWKCVCEQPRRLI